ncbi:MAG: TrkH family potassium uptake protein [Chloroflexi bacterium]|nr:TrkH family potassium uptake protein [Chloroflexota bacterium]
MSIALTAMIWLVVSVGILSVTETAVPFLSLVFEASSALGTVDLSTGTTPDLSTFGRIIIIISMMIGRVGPLAFAFSLFGNQNKTTLYRYPKEEVFVG